MLGLFVIGAIGISLIMALAWFIQRQAKNAGWVDVVWSIGTGLLGIFFALAPISAGDGLNQRQIIIAVLAGLWALRLAWDLGRRVAHGPEDVRYADLRKSWGARFQQRLFGFLQIQALASLFLGLSILLAARNPNPAIGPGDLAGIAILLIAVIGEAVGDRQLRRFKAHPEHHGKICDVGLWGLSRHPNYFFEWLGWLAYPLMAIHVDGTYPLGWLALIGPALMYWLLNYVSGIPLLEKQMLLSRGAAYRDYQQRINAFFPGPHPYIKRQS